MNTKRRFRFFQVFSRNNDIDGNPYRLLLVCDCRSGRLLDAYEARSSKPNIEAELWGICAFETFPVHLQPREYRRLKQTVSRTITITAAD